MTKFKPTMDSETDPLLEWGYLENNWKLIKRMLLILAPGTIVSILVNLYLGTPLIIGNTDKHNWMSILFLLISFIIIFLIAQTYIKLQFTLNRYGIEKIAGLVRLVFVALAVWLSISLASAAVWRYQHQKEVTKSKTETITCPLIGALKSGMRHRAMISFTLNGYEEDIAVPPSLIGYISPPFNKYEVVMEARKGLPGYYTVSNWRIRKSDGTYLPQIE